MNTAIRFTVITDNVDKAARAMYGGAADVPPFVRIVTEPRDILDLPAGTMSMARLFSRNSAAEVAFDVMRSRGMLAFPDAAFLDRIDNWLQRRDAARLTRAGGVTEASRCDAPACHADPARPATAEAKEDAPRQRAERWK